MARSQPSLSTRLTTTTALVLLAASLFSAAAHGQSGDSSIVVPDTLQLPKSFVRSLTRQLDPDKRLLNALQQFERLDLDGNGLSQEDIDRKYLIDAARVRGTIVQRYVAYDLNGDGIVSREEMTNSVLWKNRRRFAHNGGSTSARLRMKQRMKQQMEPFDEGDKNRDNQLDASEVFELAKAQADTQQERVRGMRHNRLEGSIMSLDFNSDGVVSEQEFIAAISKLTPESTMGREANAAVRVVEPGCLAPQVKPDEKLALVGAYEGDVLSNVTVLGQDQVTWVSEVVIKQGSEPLYVVLSSSNPIIWKFSGATSRVSHVVLNSHSGADRGVVGSGLTGIDKSKVSFVTGRNCLKPFYRAGGTQQAKAKAQVRDIVGRQPDHVLGQHAVASVSLPDGPIKKADRRNRPQVRIKVGSEALPVSRSTPINVDASEVVAQRPAANYIVRPRAAGLMQLLDEGKIERIDRDTFKIKQKIHIPAGLAGGHRVKFLLPKGVPEPVGDPSHSCIFSEALGRDLGRTGICR